MIRFLLMTLALLGLCIFPAVAANATFNTSVDGPRNIGQEYSWTVFNVSNQADITYHYSVYDYLVIGKSYRYYSPSWGQWFDEDSRQGKTFLALFVRGWSEGTSWYGGDQERFPLWIRSNESISTVWPEPVHMQDLDLGRGGTGRNMPAIIFNLENRTTRVGQGLLTTERYGWRDEIQMNRMEPGQSNAFDGYILYQIPDGARMEDIRVCGWFGYYGTPIWFPTHIDGDQDTLERRRAAEIQLIEYQKQQGLRESKRSGCCYREGIMQDLVSSTIVMVLAIIFLSPWRWDPWGS